MLPRFHPLVRLLFAALLFAAIISHRAPNGFVALAIKNPLALTVLCYPVILLWLWFCRRIFDRQTFASLGLRVRGAFRPLMSGVLCAVLTLGLLFGLFLICGFAHINGFSPEWRNAGARGIGILAFNLFAFCCVGATEEIVFRGYTFHNLSAWLGVRAAIWTQAILFGLVHLENVISKMDASGASAGTIPYEQWPHAFWDARWGILNIALIGVFFALSYLKTGSLWFAIGFHAVWDFVSGCILSLPVSGIRTFRVLDVSIGANNSANGGTFGVEGSVFLVAIIAVLLLMLKREKDDPQALNDLATLNPAVLETAAEEKAMTLDSGDEEAEDDPTHVSRFRTSMRPSSPQPALQLGRNGLDLSNPQNGFAPNFDTPFTNLINAPVITATTENAPTPSESITNTTVTSAPFFTDEAAPESAELAASETVSNAVVFAPPTVRIADTNAISSTRNAPTIASAPQTPVEESNVQETLTAEPVKSPDDSASLTVETQALPTQADEKVAPAQQKKTAPKW